tara:strand:+ start:976 stop:1173 length:198 start_codon:yes stop_codon:yes gene_type:complete
MAKSIVSILMKRDDYTEDEAKALVNDVADTVEKLISSGGDISEVEEIIREELGLEPDYLEELLPL